MPSPTARAALFGGAGLCLLMASAYPLSAQNTASDRVPVTVDYVSVDGIYLPIGADQGVSTGDTIAVFSDATAEVPSGSLIFVSVTRRRSVARAIDPLTLGLGDVVFLRLATFASAGAPTTTPRDAVTPRAPRALGARTSSTGPRVSGRIAMDFEARETRTAWTGDLFGETRRRFATPTTRLSFLATQLPGGLQLRANLRASYRYDELDVGPPPTSIRAYEVALTKAFDAVPVEFTLGRFGNPYESYSSYWDGILLRIGRRTGLGVGVVAGFEPSRHNEGFSNALPKLTGFADYAMRGDTWRYDTDVSFHLLRPTNGDLSYVGWSQRLAAGPLTLSQRLRVDGGVEGRSWSLRDMRLRAGVGVSGPLRLRAAYGRSRPGVYVPVDILTGPFVELTGPAREEISLGVGLTGQRGSLSVDAGRTQRDGTDAGLSVSGQAGLRLRGIQLLLSGRRWQRADAESLGLSPAVGFGIGRTEWRVGYRLYRTVGGFGAIETHAANAQLSTRIGDVFRVTARSEQQWGANLSGTRLQLGIWRSF